MSRANNFAKELARALSADFKEHGWHGGWKPAGVRHESVDVGGIARRGKSVLIEVELRRDDPVTNVAKIWRWKRKGVLKGGFVLFQAFSRFYDSRVDRRENPEFIGKEMSRRHKDVEYVPLRMRFNPGKAGREGGDYMRRAARKLATRISHRWRRVAGS